jgi:hypothetical protein
MNDHISKTHIPDIAKTYADLLKVYDGKHTPYNPARKLKELQDRHGFTLCDETEINLVDAAWRLEHHRRRLSAQEKINASSNK